MQYRDRASQTRSSVLRHKDPNVLDRCLLFVVGLDGGLESLGVGTDDLADFVTALEQKEGGHSADAELLGDIGDLVDIELEEACVGVLLRKPGAVLAAQPCGYRLWRKLT